MQTDIQKKRDELKALSAGFGQLIKAGAIESVNQGLVEYYATQGHTTIKSYNGWKKEGYQVKKGEKALLLWGSPQEKKKKDTPPIKEGEKTESFFPLAFVFSNLQVDISAHLAK